jgi:hypothetical protein
VKKPTRGSISIMPWEISASDRASQACSKQQQAHNSNRKEHAIAFQTAITRIHYELSKVRSSSIVASCVAVVVLSAFRPFARYATSSSLLAFEFLCEHGANVRFLVRFALVLVEWCPSMFARPSTMRNTDNLSR